MRRNGNEQQQMLLLWSNYGTVITDRNRNLQEQEFDHQVSWKTAKELQFPRLQI